MSENTTHLSIGRAEALVLFEMLADFQDQTCLQIGGAAERLALLRLEGALQKALVEPFLPEYQSLIDEARAQLTTQFGGQAPA